jgi:hypothetical protein
MANTTAANATDTPTDSAHWRTRSRRSGAVREGPVAFLRLFGLAKLDPRVTSPLPGPL